MWSALYRLGQAPIASSPVWPCSSWRTISKLARAGRFSALDGSAEAIRGRRLFDEVAAAAAAAADPAPLAPLEEPSACLIVHGDGASGGLGGGSAEALPRGQGAPCTAPTANLRCWRHGWAVAAAAPCPSQSRTRRHVLARTVSHTQTGQGRTRNSVLHRQPEGCTSIIGAVDSPLKLQPRAAPSSGAQGERWKERGGGPHTPLEA